MTIYEKALAALPAADIAHHESDLYLRATPEASAMVAEHRREFGRTSVSTFIDQIDHALWFDVAFAYDPWWLERAQRAMQKEVIK